MSSIVDKALEQAMVKLRRARATECQGKVTDRRTVNRRVAAKMARHKGATTEHSSVKWRHHRKEVSRATEHSYAGGTVGDALGQDAIGFEGDYTPKLLRKGKPAGQPPSEWTGEEVEKQKEKDLILLSRAPGTWRNYSKWWSTFKTFASTRGVYTRNWRQGDSDDRRTMVKLLKRMVVRMMDKYAVGTVEMLVTACARAAKDFGWKSPREDEDLQAQLKGLANLRGVSKNKKLAMVADHVAAIMDLPKPPGMSLLMYVLAKAVVIVGWWVFLRVSEMIGSGRLRSGELKEGPTGLDVCDVVFVENRMDVRVRMAKNDQSGEGHTTSVTESDRLLQDHCAVDRLKTWMNMAELKKQPGCTKGRKGCTVCFRKACVCDCTACGKLFRSVTHGKVRDHPMSRARLSELLKEFYARLEEDGVVPEGTSTQVSGISLRAGGVTEAAAQGIERELLADHGRWRSVSGVEQYDRNDQRKFARVSNALQQGLEQSVHKKRRTSGAQIGTEPAKL